MKPKRRAPTSFKIVAYFFILFGLLAAANLVFGLSNRLWLSFGVLHFFVGIGLLRLAPKSWKWAMSTVWLSMAVFASTTLLTLLTPRSGYQLNGEYFDFLPGKYGVECSAVLLGIFYWGYCVLINKKTRSLFRH